LDLEEVGRIAVGRSGAREQRVGIERGEVILRRADT
jgi:hypothetical protein